MPDTNAQTRASYDRVAADYGARFQDEMDHKPFDRRMLNWLIDRVGALGPICDLGCGPGQIARYLHSQGAETFGIDLSQKMVEQARALNPGLRFEQGDVLALTPVADQAFGGIAAFYCLIHIPPQQLPTALAEIYRVLRPDGTLLMTFHIGQEVRHLDEWWGQPVDLDFHFYEREAIKARLAEAGFTLEEAIERDPYPDIEVATRRAYLFARRPMVRSTP
jgi:SAM-dependent methyltransferase